MPGMVLGAGGSTREPAAPWRPVSLAFPVICNACCSLTTGMKENTSNASPVVHPGPGGPGGPGGLESHDPRSANLSIFLGGPGKPLLRDHPVRKGTG